jgi:menaquinol-cytochrome c reductase iron-sulfur subunit
MGSEDKEAVTSRKGFLSLVTKFTILGGLLGQGAMFIRSLGPNVLYEPLKRFKIGFPNQFSSGTNFLSEGRLFVVKDASEYHSISAVCTHLGCTVNLYKLSAPEEVTTLSGDKIVQKWEFHCPCHGSKYRGDGSVYAGPAPRDLPHWQLGMAPDGNIEVDTGNEVDKGEHLTV